VGRVPADFMIDSCPSSTAVAESKMRSAARLGGHLADRGFDRKRGFVRTGGLIGAAKNHSPLDGGALARRRSTPPEARRPAVCRELGLPQRASLSGCREKPGLNRLAAHRCRTTRLPC